MNEMAAARKVDPDRDEQFCRYCGAPIPECAVLIQDGSTGEDNRHGWVMCMNTGSDFTIQEWAEDDET